MGYKISLYFLALPSPETAILRVAARVKQGGRSIPEAVIRRRSSAGLHNFEACYKSEVDHWVKYNNLGDQPVLIEWGEANGGE
jgi:predicted ABC-type ATPase